MSERLDFPLEIFVNLFSFYVTAVPKMHDRSQEHLACLPERGVEGGRGTPLGEGFALKRKPPQCSLITVNAGA